LFGSLLPFCFIVQGARSSLRLVVIAWSHSHTVLSKFEIEVVVWELGAVLLLWEALLKVLRTMLSKEKDFHRIFSENLQRKRGAEKYCWKKLLSLKQIFSSMFL
jgi:hypothetical protein